MKKDQLFSLFFLALLLFILFHVFKIFTPFLTTAFWAFIVVFAFFPLFERLEIVLKGNKTISALIMTLLIFAVVVVPSIYLILYLSGEAFNLYVSVKNLVQTGEWQNFVQQIRETQFAQMIERQLPQWSFLTGDGLTDFLLNTSKSVGNFLASNLATFTKNIVFFLLHFLLLICLAFLFFRDGQNIYQYLYNVIPMPQESKVSVAATLDNTLTAIIRGQFLTSVAQSILAGIIFYFLGIQLFIFFGILTFIASMVPIFGASAVWAPIAIYLLMTGQLIKGAILLAAGFFGISLLDNFLKPLLIGGKVKMSVFLIFLSILGGIYAYGIPGIFIGPVVLAIFFALVRIFQEQYIKET